VRRTSLLSCRAVLEPFTVLTSALCRALLGMTLRICPMPSLVSGPA